ncbi:hypothetical protein GAU_3723 [Gemmatimonas aurantiaca T-27]|uniref:Uncharacterized protein n=1 Tax=Gemmatimonas aurantiaca (strain DSM 14586 / JCM 11422 / NBRC 100505 / T-27) TaxID=379066 RepID=C1AE38_GEMAT|nr:hypothetical protein GAU_3723 [Gemmatimonas aurantiaca T-27]
MKLAMRITLAGAVSACDGSRTLEEERVAAAEQVAKAAEADRARFQAYFARPDTNDRITTMDADEWLSRYDSHGASGSVVETVHRVAVRARLDSAEVTARELPGDEELRFVLRMELNKIVPPLSTRDSNRLAGIRKRVEDAAHSALLARASAETISSQNTVRLAGARGDCTSVSRNGWLVDFDRRGEVALRKAAGPLDGNPISSVVAWPDAIRGEPMITKVLGQCDVDHILYYLVDFDDDRRGWVDVDYLHWRRP